MLKNFLNSTKIQLSKLKSSNLKGILNVIGSIIIYRNLGSLYTWSNINVYLVSYLKQYNSPNIEIVDGFFLMPIVLVISNFSNYIGTTIEEKLGFKKCLILSLLMGCGSHFILIFTTRLVIIYFLMIIFGIENWIQLHWNYKKCLALLSRKKRINFRYYIIWIWRKFNDFFWICR